MTALDRTEASRLATLEATIERGLGTFVEVGEALREIRDGRLYREQYGTFEGYCREQWGISRSHAHRTIEAADVAATLPIGNKPANEAQARELARLDGEQARQSAWGEAVGWAQGEGRKVTATDVRRAVQGRLSKDHPSTPEPEPQHPEPVPTPAPAEEVDPLAVPEPSTRPTGGASANGQSPVPESPPPPKSPAAEVAALADCGRRLAEVAARLDVEAATQESDEAEVDAWRAAWTELRDRADELLERSLSKAEMAKVEATAGRIGVKLLL